MTPNMLITEQIVKQAYRNRGLKLENTATECSSDIWDIILVLVSSAQGTCWETIDDIQANNSML